MAIYINNESLTPDYFLGSYILNKSKSVSVCKDAIHAAELHKLFAKTCLEEVEDIESASIIANQMGLVGKNADHIYRFNQTGRDDYDYIVLSCDICNALSKRDILLRFIKEFRSMYFYSDILKYRKEDTMNTIYKYHSPLEWVTASFSWFRSDEGEDVWVERDRKWREKVSCILLHIVHPFNYEEV